MSLVGATVIDRQTDCRNVYTYIQAHIEVISPGSVRPRATIESNPEGGAVSVQSSIVIECSLPSAT